MKVSSIHIFHVLDLITGVDLYFEMSDTFLSDICQIYFFNIYTKNININIIYTSIRLNIINNMNIIKSFKTQN